MADSLTDIVRSYLTIVVVSDKLTCTLIFNLLITVSILGLFVYTLHVHATVVLKIRRTTCKHSSKILPYATHADFPLHLRSILHFFCN